MIHSTFAASVKALAIVAAVFLAFHGAIFICTVSVNSAKMHEVVTAIWLDITAAILFVEIVKCIIRRAMLAHQIIIRRAMLAHQIIIRRAMILPTKAAIIVALILYHTIKFTVIVVKTPYEEFRRWVEWRQKRKLAAPCAEFRQWVEWRQKRKLAAIRLQAFTRRVLAHKKYYPTIQERIRARKNNAAVKIQSVFRRHEARKKLEELQAARELRRAIQSAIMIRTIVRGQSATKIQSVFRRHQARKELEKLRAAKELRRAIQSAIMIRAIVRGQSATKIQSVFRRHQARKELEKLRRDTNAAVVRGALVRARVKRAHAKQCHRFSGIFGAMLQILMYLVMSYSLYTPPATTTNFTDSMPKPFEDTMVKFLPLADDEIKAFVRETQAAVEIQNVWRSYKERKVERRREYRLKLLQEEAIAAKERQERQTTSAGMQRFGL